MTRVLVVDDSPSVRELLLHILGSDPEIMIVGWAVDGEDAVRMAESKKPDVITMDLHMPNVDGVEATRRIMQNFPVPIVIVTGSDNPAEVGAGFRAIEAGALMIVQRPFGVGHAAHAETSDALVRAVKAMAEVKVVRRWPKEVRKARGSDAAHGIQAKPQARRLVLLGASTGGPAVLRDILAQLPSNYPLPIVMVQHMSAGFAIGLAEWLTAASDFSVGIALQGEYLAGGKAYLAPDGFQISVTRDLRIGLDKGPLEHGMRPSVSHLFRSIHADLCRSTVAVLLTGMGKDGALELKQLKDSGAITMVQDRATAAVYGMPGEAIRQDAATFVLEPVEIGKVLRAIAGSGDKALTLPAG